MRKEIEGRFFETPGAMEMDIRITRAEIVCGTFRSSQREFETQDRLIKWYLVRNARDYELFRGAQFNKVLIDSSLSTMEVIRTIMSRLRHDY